MCMYVCLLLLFVRLYLQYCDMSMQYIYSEESKFIIPVARVSFDFESAIRLRFHTTHTYYLYHDGLSMLTSDTIFDIAVCRPRSVLFFYCERPFSLLPA